MANVMEATYQLMSTFWTELHLRKTQDGWIPDFIRDLRRYCYWTIQDSMYCLTLALFFTVLRYGLTKIVFTPFVKWAQLTEANAKKFPESFWKFLYYSSTSSFCFYMCATKYPFFSKPESVWIGWHRGVDVPVDIYVLYVAQLGFYVHSLYATARMDDVRKDYVIMYIHHTVSCLLIGFSLGVRYHNIGVLLFTLHDINDVILEGCKCLLYVKVRGGKEYPIWENVANVGFAIFCVTWDASLHVVGFVLEGCIFQYIRLFIGGMHLITQIQFLFAQILMRVYWFFYKIIYNTGYLSVTILPSGPFYFFFNFMLWTVFLMNCWWYFFIILAAVRILTGRNLKDTREETTIPEKEETPIPEKEETAMTETDEAVDNKTESKNAAGEQEREVVSGMDVGEVEESLAGLDLGGKVGVGDGDEEEVETMEVDEEVDETQEGVRRRNVGGEEEESGE